MLLSMPSRLIRELGLVRQRTRTARTAAEGDVVRDLWAGRLDDPGIAIASWRWPNCPMTCPVLIGQVPLELLDFVVDPARQRLIGNPEHGGEHMMDMF